MKFVRIRLIFLVSQTPVAIPINTLYPKLLFGIQKLTKKQTTHRVVSTNLPACRYGRQAGVQGDKNFNSAQPILYVLELTKKRDDPTGRLYRFKPESNFLRSEFFAYEWHQCKLTCSFYSHGHLSLHLCADTCYP